MALLGNFQSARRLLEGLSPDERERLQGICFSIQRAEEELAGRAETLLSSCTVQCKGMCCRNVDLNAIIGTPDFVYILTMAPWVRETIIGCLAREHPLFSSNCIFLADGVGPCLFPENVRPEVCLTAFCGDDSPVKAEIRHVKKQFFQLSLFLILARASRAGRFIRKFVLAVAEEMFRSHRHQYRDRYR